MKYWRGYLVAAIIALCTWALGRFCAAHTQLVDMVYPYVDRIVMDYLANWSSGIEGCLWQVLLIFGIVMVLGSAILMIVFRFMQISFQRRFPDYITIFAVLQRKSLLYAMQNQRKMLTVVEFFVKMAARGLLRICIHNLYNK